MNELEKALIKTKSIKIADAKKPFWYTSGTIGPYFINTHFLIKNENEANKILSFIDKNKNNHKKFIPELIDRILSFYKSSIIYKKSMDYLYSLIKKNKEFNECEYISGGERRDWFFSPIIAYLSQKKLLFIYKDLQVYDNNNKITDLKKSKVCHICDLVTQASSFKRAWIPAIQNINGRLVCTISIVDRDEGGYKFFHDLNINYIPVVIIDKYFFDNLLKQKIINKNQVELIQNYKNNPIIFGKNFLLNNPEYLLLSLKDKKNTEKAKRCLDDNIYSFDFSTKPFSSLKYKK